VTGTGGKVREGLELDFTKRNSWGNLNPLSFGVLLEDVLEFTGSSAPHSSLSAFGSGRWYALSPIGVVVDLGVNSQDLSGANLHPWSFESRYGLVLSVGKLDIVVESPAIPRFSFVSGELLSARLALEGWEF